MQHEAVILWRTLMNDARVRSFGTAHSTLCIILVIWLSFVHRTCFRRHRILVRWVEIRMHALANPISGGMELFVSAFSFLSHAFDCADDDDEDDGSGAAWAEDRLRYRSWAKVTLV
jgi:hypothetical protein